MARLYFSWFFPILHLFWSNTCLNIFWCNNHVIPNMVVTDTNWWCQTWRSIMAHHSFCPRIAGITAHGGRHLSESSSLARSRLCSLLRTAFNWLPLRRYQHRPLSRALAREGKADPPLRLPLSVLPLPAAPRQPFRNPPSGPGASALPWHIAVPSSARGQLQETQNLY